MDTRKRCSKGAPLFIAVLLGGCGEDSEVTGVGVGLSTDVERIQRIERGEDSVFAAKFICGETTTNEPLVNAVYRTEISTGNPLDSNIALSYRVAFVFPSSPPAIIPPGLPDPLSTPFTPSVGSFRGSEISCQDIRNLLADSEAAEQISPDSPLVKGYVMIASEDSRLIVNAVYTTLHKQIHGNRLVDLVPATICGFDSLTVTVRNDGQTISPETVTLVTIDGQSQNVATPAIDADEEIEFDPFPTNPGFYQFLVTVDPDEEVDESDEMNNTVIGVCEFEPPG
jgi:hypothetical protein